LRKLVAASKVRTCNMTVCCGVLQYVAACCSVLQRVAMFHTCDMTPLEVSRDTHTGTERERQTDRHKKTDRHRHRHRHADTDIDTDTDTHKEAPETRVSSAPITCKSEKRMFRNGSLSPFERRSQVAMTQHRNSSNMRHIL